jgi:hypothetical protein
MAKGKDKTQEDRSRKIVKQFEKLLDTDLAAADRVLDQLGDARNSKVVPSSIAGEKIAD